MRFLHHEVSSEAIQGYVRQGTQIEQVWQQLEDKVTELTLQGLAPWDAYSKMGYALAFARACRLNIVVVQQLLEAADPAHSGFLPRSTYDQAKALGELFEPYLEEAIRLLDERYVSRQRLPLQLRRVRHEGQYAPAHLLGVIAAGHEVREWTAGLLAQYSLAIEAPRLPIPSSISTHLDAMNNQLALGDFHLESGFHLIGEVRTGKQVPEAIAAQGEDLLWEAMEGFYQISQLLVAPGVQIKPAPARPAARPAPQPSSGSAPAAPQVNTSARTSAHVSDLLGQLNHAHPGNKASSPGTTAADLLQELQMHTAQESSPRPSTDASALLDQLNSASPPAQPPAKTVPGSKRNTNEGASTTEQQVADLLSDIGGE